MRCPICNTAEPTWTNVDKYRTKPEGMALCQTCGFISYPQRYKSKEEIIAYYKKDYRPAPTASNLFTGERKIQYHAHFLSELFHGWRESGRNDFEITDIGSATGQALNWIRSQLPGATVTGVELTTSFARNAWHVFKVETRDDFDDTKKYDLIVSYKSLEHILDPDVELRRYITSLKPEGYLYISVPLWFEQMKNFGMSGFDIEYYYSPNHINTWTRKHFEGLLKACGGEVVKENQTYYEATYLVKRNDDLIPADRTSLYEDPEKITENLQKFHAAAEAMQLGQYARAIEIWPNCPSAWAGLYETNRKGLHDLGFEGIYREICVKAIDSCNDDADMHYLAADICARYDQYEKSIEHLKVANQLRPNQPHVFSLLVNCFGAMGKVSKDEATKVKFYEQARQASKILGDIATQHRTEAMTWTMFYNALIPTPFEAKA